ncbi:MAG: hypothetical protein FJ295_20875 [Planctomycetes bacterium]|nr:hypothetical protein [Planctomycetota bacterium]
MSAGSTAKWSVNVGTWCGVGVQIHGSWFLVAVATFYLNWLRLDRTRETIVDWLSVAVLVILFVSVLAHELGHLWAVRRVDGMVECLVLAPLGGLSHFRINTFTNGEILIALAGPIVNLFLAACVCFPMVLSQGRVDLAELLNPLDPEGLTVGSAWVVLAKLGLWINTWLLLVNLIPAPPFDGGQITKALAGFPRLQQVIRSPAEFIDRFGQLVALGLLILAICTLLSTAPRNGRIVPSWLLLSVLATVIFCSSRQTNAASTFAEGTDDLDQPFGYDFSQGYTSLERSSGESQAASAGPFSRWIEQRKKARQHRQLEQEAEDEKQVDEVLARLHEVGIEGLSQDERLLLQRVSARYRDRKQS